MNNNSTTVYQSAAVLDAAATLASEIIRKVAGNEVANTINNSTLTSEAVRSIIISRIQSKLKIS